MRRLMRAGFGQMQAVQPAGQNGIVRRQKDQAVRFFAQRFAQGAAARGVARTHDHQAAFGQGARRAQRIGQALVIGEQGEYARVEAGGGSC